MLKKFGYVRIIVIELILFSIGLSSKVDGKSIPSNWLQNRNSSMFNIFPQVFVPQLIILDPLQPEKTISCSVKSQLETHLECSLFDFVIKSNRSILGNVTENKHQCVQRRTFLTVDENIFLADCLSVEVNDHPELDHDTQGITLTFKMNTTTHCLNSVEIIAIFDEYLLAFEEELDSQDLRDNCSLAGRRDFVLHGACEAASSSGKSGAGFQLVLDKDFFDEERIHLRPSPRFFGYHPSFWTNSSTQILKYEREYQKALGFIIGMFLPIIILLYMSFYLTCCKNSGNLDANMFGSDKT